MPSLRTNGPGSYRLRLRPNETTLLRELISQLRDQLLASTDAPLVQRLFPPAYADDAERDAGYPVLTRDELLEGKLRALATVDAGLGPPGEATAVDLDEEALSAWMQALNSLRLVLGTRLDVDDEPHELDPEDPLLPEYAVYEFLGWLVAQAVDALAGNLDQP